MKAIIRTITVVGKSAAIIAGATQSDVLLATIPQGRYAVYAAVVFAASSTIKDIVLLAGDLLDDGQRNGSFKLDK